VSAKADDFVGCDFISLSKALKVRLHATMNFISRATPLVALFLSCSTAFALPNPTELISAQGGPIKITPIYHASLQIEYRGFVIQVDPFSAGNYSGAKKADTILITHPHSDHYDVKALRSLIKNDTFVLAPPSVVAQLKTSGLKIRSNGIVRILNGSSFTNKTNMSGPSLTMSFQGVPAYNIVRGPKPGQKFHPKGEFDGYILTLGGKRIYIAGDTEATPEMKALKNIDVAFLPMNLPYTMTPQEAATGAKAFRPKIVYPYHYRFPFDQPNSNPQQFKAALAGTGIEVRIRNWYGHPATK